MSEGKVEEIRVGIYTRLSDEDKNKKNPDQDSMSIANQKQMLVDYAKKNGWTIYDVYSDDDYAGSDRKRPEFNRLLKDAEQKKFHIVLCKSQSRFTREMELVEKYLHNDFIRWGIRFIGLTDNSDTAVKGNKKSRQINGLINEWYLEDLSANIKVSLRSRMKQGKHIGSFPLYGYLKHPTEKGQLIIDDEAAKIVRRVFEMYASGMGRTAIAKVLNNEGIPNPTAYKKQKGLKYKQPTDKSGTLWKYFSISDMLMNEMYIGNMVQSRYGSISYKTGMNKPKPKSEWIIVEGTHEAIIDAILWSKVQSILKERCKPGWGGNVGLFANKVKCGQCGATLRSSRSGGRQYLQCPTKPMAETACVGAFVNQAKLEKAILNELKKLNDQFVSVDEIEKDIVTSQNILAAIEDKKRIIQELKDKVDGNAKAVKEAYMDKIKGLITEQLFLDITEQLTTEKASVESALQNNKMQLNEMEEKQACAISKRDIVTRYLETETLTRDMLHTLVDKILIIRDPLNKKNQSIEIHWNF